MNNYGMAKEHNPKSKEIYEYISSIDFQNGDYFIFKSGGDGDNGEFLMDLLDRYFEDNEIHFSISVPNWCIIGKTIAWKSPKYTGCEWVKDRILSYGVDGFFHQGYNCPVYYTKFSEYGVSVKEVKDIEGEIL